MAVVWDGSVIKVYLNGELQQTAENHQGYTLPHNYFDQVPPVENKMYLGSANGDSVPYYGKFAIDEWYYWNNKLSDQAIRKIYAKDQ